MNLVDVSRDQSLKIFANTLFLSFKDWWEKAGGGLRGKGSGSAPE